MLLGFVEGWKGGPRFVLRAKIIGIRMMMRLDRTGI